MVRPIEKGFTLIELMIVVAILGIIAAIAYPSYVGYIEKGKRVDMMTEMQQIGSRIEANKITYKRYDRIPLNEIYSNSVTGTATTFPNSGEALYTVSIETLDNATPPNATAGLLGGNWLLTAAPISGTQMANDGILTLDFEGEKCRGSVIERVCGFGDEWK